MARVSNDQGVTVTTIAGLQPRQYRDQLVAAGLLAKVARERNLITKRRLSYAASNLVAHLRRGEVSTATKALAAELGLHVTPNGAQRVVENTNGDHHDKR